VDLLAKNAKAAWAAGDILFKKGIAKEEEGELFLNQVFAFVGKKADKKDDAPDVLISANELIHEMALVKRPSVSQHTSFTITNTYSF